MAFLLFRPFHSIFFAALFISIMYPTVSYGRQIFKASLITAFDYEVLATNFGEYNKNRILADSGGRERTVEYKGGKKTLGGFYFEYRPSFFEKSEKARITFNFRSTLLTGQSNDNSNNLSDQAVYGIEGENSFIISTNLYYQKWVLSISREVLSIGKVKSIDVSNDGEGNTGDILGTYNLRLKRTLVSIYRRLGDFPFVLGLRGHRETIPRMPQTYESGRFQGSGPFQNITYQSLSVSMELGEGEYLSDYSVDGFKWSMLFAIGLAEYDFVNYENMDDGESSSTVHFKGTIGYQWNFTMGERAWFLRWDNQYSVTSFDNNDNNADALQSTVHRTSGSDEEYSLLLRTGVRFP